MQREYEKFIRPTISVDFDDTIYDIETGEMKLGASRAIEELKIEGYEIVISSCRTSPRFKNHPMYRTYVDHMIHFLDSHGVVYDRIDFGDEGKIVAEHYIDDR